MYVASNVFITRLEDVSPPLLSSCMGPTGQPDDDFMPAFTRWKREHFESGFLELRGGREVSGIALSTGRVTHRPQRRTSTDFNFYSTTLPRQLCSYVASLFFPPLSPPTSLIPLGLIRLTQGGGREGGREDSHAPASLSIILAFRCEPPHVYTNIQIYSDYAIFNDRLFFFFFFNRFRK